MKIPFAKPQINYKEVENVFETLKTGILVHGNKTIEFEKKLHNFIGNKKNFVSTTSSCTAAMHLFLLCKKSKKMMRLFCLHNLMLLQHMQLS